MEKILLQGICYDEKSSFLRGAAAAPPLIRQAYRSDSANYYAENGTEIRPEVFYDVGDYKVSDYFEIERLTTANLRKGLPVISLGGDHSITYPLVKAMHAKYGKIDILHIDAHADLYQEFEGDPYSHACPFARIMEDGLASGLTQAGIRTLTTHQTEQAEKWGVNISPLASWDISQLPVFRNPIYLSLDLDALDPAFAPGVSHHEPGGFSTRQVLDIIHRLEVPLLGADIVEYNPKRDLQQMTAMVCAKFLRELASLMV